MNTHIKNRGFTLIELLVVIAIIGILASIVMGHVSDSRAKAEQARVTASIRSVQTIATTCMDDEIEINAPGPATPVCAGKGNWPEPLGGGWSYADAGSCVFDGDINDSAFMYCATNGTDIIACTESGCTTS